MTYSLYLGATEDVMLYKLFGLILLTTADVSSAFSGLQRQFWLDPAILFLKVA
jgi:hypothetical protein